MWLVTTQGFYSVVAHRDNPGVLLVRCRVKADLKALREQIPDLRIFNDPKADYYWRAEVTRAEWMAAAASLAADIDYSNFKHEVLERQGEEREAIYMRVWIALSYLQEHPPWSGGRRRRKLPRLRR